MTKLRITYDIATAMATDAGNRSMKHAGRVIWNNDDFDAACRTMDEVWWYRQSNAMVDIEDKS